MTELTPLVIPEFWTMLLSLLQQRHKGATCDASTEIQSQVFLQLIKISFQNQFSFMICLFVNVCTLKCHVKLHSGNERHIHLLTMHSQCKEW